jgi:hypothetical protein
MPVNCPAPPHLLPLTSGKVENIPLQAERHSGPTQKLLAFPTGIGVRLQTGMLFGFTTECCSASDRNRVRLRPDSPPGEERLVEGEASAPGTATQRLLRHAASS